MKTKRAKSPTKGKSKAPRARVAKPARAKTMRVKTTRPKRKPAARDQLDDFIDAAARALDLPLEPAWRAAVKSNLDVTLRLATLFADFPLPDDSEPAPVFVA
jgi:hypothetical protein